MTVTKRMELVNVEVDAADSFRLGIKLKASPDGLKLFATFRRHPPEPPIIEEFVRKAGVKADVNVDQFRDLAMVLDIVNRKDPVLMADLTPGALSHIDWKFAEHQEAVESYWERRQIEEGALLPGLRVEKGDLVATRQSAEALGAKLDYVDVFGKKREGINRVVRLEVGKGLKEDDKGNIVATEGGFLLLIEHTVSVRGKLVLESQAEVGPDPVTFLGSIEVKPKVTKAKSLMAANDLTIQGHWKAGNLKADGTIRIQGELSGEETIEVEAKGAIEASFVNNSRLRCEGDITIDSGAFFSIVRALGVLNVPRGAVVGGRFYGAKGIRVLEAGDADGESTILSAGYTDRIADSIGAVIAEHARIESKILEIQTVLRPYLEDPESQEILDDEGRATLNQLIGGMKALRDEYLRLGTHIAENYHGEYDDARITVAGKVHPGVVIVINNVELPIENLASKVEFRFDPKTRKILVS